MRWQTQGGKRVAVAKEGKADWLGLHGIVLFKIEIPYRNLSFTTVDFLTGAGVACCCQWRPRQNGVEIIVRVVAIALVAALAALLAGRRQRAVESGIGCVWKTCS
jgi:hypothetical protein